MSLMPPRVGNAGGEHDLRGHFPAPTFLVGNQEVR
jgi:hypothetical protein